MPSDSVQGAIKEYLPGTAIWAVVGGRYWLGEAPPGTVLPFLVLKAAGGSSSLTSGNRHERTKLTFVVSASKGEDAKSMALLVQGDFKETTVLPFAPGLAQIALWLRTPAYVVETPGFDPTAQKVFQGRVDYEILVSRER